eukprot:TRINITY_DN73512_c0_g1_i1.p1 TRINITY_DN73512_c0_g1~~TRINITY_DN73512_c0_g1_i1.p1  ORF type:complete len:816 (+),score=141.88 TRINITY_DN73512_c0_g1_i1:177-2624(+)
MLPGRRSVARVRLGHSWNAARPQRSVALATTAHHSCDTTNAPPPKLHRRKLGGGVAGGGITKHVKASAWPLALDHLREEGNGAVDVASYGLLLRACAHGGHWSLALHLFDLLPTCRLQPNLLILSSVIKACGSAGRWQAAVSCMASASSSDLTPNIYTINATIGACAKGRAMDAALQIFQSMHKAEVQPHLVTYSLLISAHEKQGQPERAVEMFEKMVETKITPDIVAYSTVISACASSSHAARALDVFDEAVKSALKPTVITYSAAIHACAKSEQWEWQRAIQLLRSMEQESLRANVITYSSVMSACANSWQWERALSLLQEMKQAGVRPNLYSYNTAIAACAKTGQWIAALQVLSDISSSALSPNLMTYNSVITAFEKGGHWRRALALLTDLEEHGPTPDVISYDATLLALASVKAWQECLRLLQRKAALGMEQGRHVLGAATRCFMTPEVPVHQVASALSFFKAGVGGITRLDLEDVARRFEGSASDGSGQTVAGEPLRWMRPLRANVETHPSLEREVDDILQDMAPNSSTFFTKMGVVMQDLDALACSAYKSARVQPFGSAVEGTVVGGGDIDVSVEITVEELRRSPAVIDPSAPGSHLLQTVGLAELLQRAQNTAAWSIKGAVFSAETPVLSLHHMATGCKVDLTVNNTVCVEKSRVVNEKCPSLAAKQLVQLLKTWAKRRCLYGKALGRLSGFALTQMAIFAAQLAPRGASAAQLLQAFFLLYSEDFDWKQECVSIVVGQRVGKASQRLHGIEHLCIEDCVERGIDLCATHLLPEESATLKAEIDRGALLLKTAGSRPGVVAELMQEKC